MKFAVDFLSVYAALVPVMLFAVLCLPKMRVKITLKWQVYVMHFLNFVPVLLFLICFANFNGPIIIIICFGLSLVLVACLIIFPLGLSVLCFSLISGILNSAGGITLFLCATSNAYKDERVIIAVIMALFAIGASIAYAKLVKKWTLS
jgi:hypothetical protein